jgi:hypothetical protein
MSAPSLLNQALVVRPASASDAHAVRALAELDAQAAPSGAVLLAEVDDRPVAALEVESGRVAADPFVRTAEAVNVLRMRREQLRGARVRRARLRFARGLAVSR